ALVEGSLCCFFRKVKRDFIAKKMKFLRSLITEEYSLTLYIEVKWFSFELTSID
ncbi:MAG: hypothetical protein ACJAVY_002163, partial [Marinoscillum sp.]